MKVGLRILLSKDTSLFSNKERTDLFRYAFLNLCESIDARFEKAFDFREEGFPDVIYQKPFKNSMTIFIKEHSYAHALLNKLLFALKNQKLLIQGEEFVILDIEKIYDNLIVPAFSNEEIRYKTITPLLLFTRKTFPIFYAINKAHENEKDKQEALKNKAADMIRSNLKWQVQQQIGYRSMDVLDKIDIEWEDFTIKMVEFHKNELKTPAIFGTFKTHWNLPRFVGQKIGKGFGQINQFKGAM